MYEFHNGLYTDVRIEDVFETQILYTKGSLDESKVRRYRAAFVRVYDGIRWYYASTSDLANLQQQIDQLSKMAKPNPDILTDPIIKRIEANKGTYEAHKSNNIRNIAKQDKVHLLEQFFPLLSKNEALKMWRTIYIDNNTLFSFYSSKGADLHYDVQRVGFSVNMSFSVGEKNLTESFQRGSSQFQELLHQESALVGHIQKCEAFLAGSKPVKPGEYEVILSPLAAGVFAHESFGHKSEADFMVGDETMKKEWAIGTKVGADILSIVDTGTEPGSGFVPFDQEGTAATSTYLIKNGILTGRLHSASTAASLDEEVTGNARAMNYEYEPIVRMTTTYILPGALTKPELFSGVKDGFYIETIKHGSGMSTFTIAPSLAYRIQNGQITDPVNISVITGTVFETLSEINGLSDELELLSFVTGGCGKLEQWPLPVGFGGPYVRVGKMKVQ